MSLIKAATTIKPWGQTYITIDGGLRLTGSDAAFYVKGNASVTVLRIGDWVGSGATGSAVPFSTAQNVYSDGQLDIVGAFGESSSDLTSAYSAKCGRFRHLVSGSTITVAHETYGLMGQVCGKGATMTHLHAGLIGTFEGTGASVVANSSYSVGHAGVMSRVGGGGNITATTPLAGFLAFWNGAALASGTSVAYATSYLTTPWAIGLYMPSGSTTKGIDITCSAIGASGRIAKLYGTCAAANMGDGYGAVEIDLTASGTLAGMCAASSIWVNMASGSLAGGNSVMPLNVGIWAATNTPVATAKLVMGMRMQCVIDDETNPGSLYLFDTNIKGNALTAMFCIHAAVDIGWASGTKSGGTAGNFPIFRDETAGVTHYVNTYTA